MKPEEAQLSMLIGRQRDIDVVFRGDYHDLSHCNQEAIQMGHCSEDELGKFLVKDGVNAYNEMMGTSAVGIGGIRGLGFTETFQTNDTGYYCIKSFSPVLKSYDLNVWLKDGWGTNADERSETTRYKWTLYGAALVFVSFAVLWCRHLTDAPFVIKHLLLLSFGYLLDALFNIWTPFDFFQPILNLNRLLCWFFESFMIYEYSYEFRLDRPELHGRRYLWLHTGVQLGVFLIRVTLDLDGTSFELRQVLHLTDDVLVWGLMGLILWLRIATIGHWVEVVKEYNDFKKTGMMIYKQFTALFWLEYGLWVLYVTVYVLATPLESLLKHSALYRDLLMVDGQVGRYPDVKRLVYAVLYPVMILVVSLCYWRPSQVKKSMNELKTD